MNNQESKFNHIEIKDLIDGSVANAIERKKIGLDSNEYLIELSEKESKNIIAKGNISGNSITSGMITCGMICPEEY